MTCEINCANVRAYVDDHSSEQRRLGESAHMLLTYTKYGCRVVDEDSDQT